MIEKLARQAESWGVEITDVQIEALLEYAEKLAGYEKANVIGVRRVDEILLNHVLDSLSCLLFAPLAEGASLIDVGSGGGLPGIPIALIRPEVNATLLEATGKKTEFLRYAIEGLALENVRVLGGRAENVGTSKEERGGYDFAVIRAVAGLNVNCEYCVPLLGEGGYMISMKGRISRSEVVTGERAAGLLGAGLAEIVPVPFLPELPDKERNLVVVRKIAATPAQYPRKDGVPKKSPLGA